MRGTRFMKEFNELVNRQTYDLSDQGKIDEKNRLSYLYLDDNLGSVCTENQRIALLYKDANYNPQRVKPSLLKTLNQLVTGQSQIIQQNQYKNIPPQFVKIIEIAKTNNERLVKSNKALVVDMMERKYRIIPDLTQLYNKGVKQERMEALINGTVVGDRYLFSYFPDDTVFQTEWNNIKPSLIESKLEHIIDDTQPVLKVESVDKDGDGIPEVKNIAPEVPKETIEGEEKVEIPRVETFEVPTISEEDLKFLKDHINIITKNNEKFSQPMKFIIHPILKNKDITKEEADKFYDEKNNVVEFAKLALNDINRPINLDEFNRLMVLIKKIINNNKPEMKKVEGNVTENDRKALYDYFRNKEMKFIKDLKIEDGYYAAQFAIKNNDKSREQIEEMITEVIAKLSKTSEVITKGYLTGKKTKVDNDRAFEQISSVKNYYIFLEKAHNKLNK